VKTIYLDNNATTPLDPRVVRVMTRFLTETFGNPSSSHRVGQAAAAGVEKARGQLADVVGARPEEIIFTSGGTEADNLALRGVAAARPDKRHLVISSVEHPAVADTAHALEQMGVRVTCVPVDRLGRLNLDRLADAIDERTVLVSVMLANNETGVLFPIERVGEVCRRHGVPLHVDAVQALGKVSIDLAAWPVDLMSFSAHKLHGPKGAGALFVRSGVELRARQLGGHQERDRRGGTENVAGIVGLGEAARLAREHADELPRIRQLRDRFEQTLCKEVPDVHVIGDREQRLPNTSNIAFAGVRSDGLLMALSERGVCASGGSACHSGSIEPSGVLLAMGVDADIARGAVRFSLSRFTAEQDIDEVLDCLPGFVHRLRSSAHR
jgi:cysteine desulfurase